MGGFYECHGFALFLSVTMALGVNETLLCPVSLQYMLGKCLYSVPHCGG